MTDRRVIFFDVGNTLLFPNRAKMLAPIASDRHPTLETLAGSGAQNKNRI